MLYSWDFELGYCHYYHHYLVLHLLTGSWYIIHHRTESNVFNVSYPCTLILHVFLHKNQTHVKNIYKIHLDLMCCRRRSWYIVSNVAFLDNEVSVVALFCLLNPPWKEFPVHNVTSSSHKWWSALTYTRPLPKEDIVPNINVSVLRDQFSYSTLCYYCFYKGYILPFTFLCDTSVQK